MQSTARHKSCLRGIREHVRTLSAHQASKTLSLALVFALFRANIVLPGSSLSPHVSCLSAGKMVQIQGNSQTYLYVWCALDVDHTGVTDNTDLSLTF